MSSRRVRTRLVKPRYYRDDSEPKMVYAMVATPVNGVLWWDVNNREPVTVSPHVE